MFAYCLNRPIVCVDSTGERTYFINGINNDEENEAPYYAIAFEEELERLGIKDVRVIPVYNSQSGFWGTLKGVCQVALEMINYDVYSDRIAAIVLNDIIENPLAEGETLNIIGYSGGGQLALNVMEKLNGKIDNVILIGTPVMEIFDSSTRVFFIYAGLDPLSWNIGCGFSSYFAGWIGHTDYFKPTMIQNIATIVDSIID